MYLHSDILEIVIRYIFVGTYLFKTANEMNGINTAATKISDCMSPSFLGLY